MIKIEHVYCTRVYIIYYYNGEPYTYDNTLIGTIDKLTELVCEVLIKNMFNAADICDAETGEILTHITRS